MKVTIVKQKAEVSLIEYIHESAPVRVWIPRDEITAGEVRKDVIRRGIGYGLPFSELLGDSVGDDMRKTFERLMRNRGIWTLHDVLTKPQVLQGVFKLLMKNEIANMASRAREYSATIKVI